MLHCISCSQKWQTLTFFQYVWYLFVLCDVTTGAVRTNIVIWTHFYDNTMSAHFLKLRCDNAPFTAQWDSCSFKLTNSILWCFASNFAFHCMITCLMSYPWWSLIYCRRSQNFCELTSRHETTDNSEVAYMIQRCIYDTKICLFLKVKTLTLNSLKQFKTIQFNLMKKKKLGQH